MENFGKFSKKSLKENFMEATKDSNFNTICNSLDCSDDIKMKYTTHLKDISKQIEICSKCKKLDNCPYKVKGTVEYPYVEDNCIKFGYKFCKKKIKYDKDTEYLKHVKYYQTSEMLKSANLKDIFKDDANRLEAVREIKAFYDGYTNNKDVRGIYLYGNFGSGKSYFIAALFNELARKGYDSIIVYLPELIRSLKASFSNTEDNEFESRFNELKETPLLLLDDIGAENVTNWSRDEIIGSIVQYRMENNLPTFFTSNYSMDELARKLEGYNQDKLAANRIMERIKFISTEIEMIGVNRRN